jgi:hypothetical protein
MKHAYPLKANYLLSMVILVWGTLASVTSALAQPAIATVSPAANAQAVVRSSPVTIGFTQPLTMGSSAALKVFSSQRGGLRTQGINRTVVNGSTLQFTPSTYPFAPGETVFSTVTTAAASASGVLALPQVGGIS